LGSMNLKRRKVNAIRNDWIHRNAE
jgi:hypothetical protein